MRLRNLVIAVSAATLAVGLTACSSDSSGSGGASSGNGPIVIGVANMDTGTVAFPGATELAKAAVEHINKDLGGIHGRQVKIVTCDMKNDEATAQQCGQQFANDKGMVAAISTLNIYGAPFNASLEAAGKPVFGSVPLTQADGNSKGVRYFYAGADSYVVPVAKWLLDQPDVKKISVFIGDDPSSTNYIKGITTLLEKAGKTVNLQVVPAGTANLTSAVVAAKAKDADLIYAGPVGACAALSEAFRSLEIVPKKVLTTTACADPATIADNPDAFQGWNVTNPIELPVGGGKDADELNAAWEKYGAGGDVPAYGETGWGGVMTLATILQAMPEADMANPEKVSAAIDGFKGPVNMGADKVSCPGPTLPSMCSEQASFYVVAKDGSLTPTAP